MRDDKAYLLGDSEAACACVVGAVPFQLHWLVQNQIQVS